MSEYLFNSLRQRIIDSMLYFEVFSYPMTREEVFQTTNLPNIRQTDVDNELESLVEEGFLFRIEEYYLTKKEPGWVGQRKEKNQRADRYLKIGLKMGKFISWFPYVRGVCISGSLSKHWMSKDGDIDYFIITTPGKLWIARSFLILFKKIFLLNSHKYFCVNYFLDEENLEVEEKNRFTATEIATLIPVAGPDSFTSFINANGWIRQYYPNFPNRKTRGIPEIKRGIIKRLVEFALNNSFGINLDTWLRKKTLAHWKRKFGTMTEEEFNVALKSTEYVSKHHPNHFQNKVLNAHQKKLEEFEKEFRIAIGKANLTA